MANARDQPGRPTQRPTLLEAIKDFGWLPLLLISIGGGLAIIDIAERVVFEGLSLITPFQIVLNGYNRVTEVIGAIVEPVIQPTINWLNVRLDAHFELQPFWRSLFVLVMVFVQGVVRAEWRGGRWGHAILTQAVVGLGALAGAVVAGLLPPAGGWWAQGLVAAVPLALLILAIGMAYRLFLRKQHPSAPVAKRFVSGFRGATRFGAIGFVAGAGLSLVPALNESAGLVALGALIAWRGGYLVYHGLREAYLDASRAGLSMLGGFVAAGAILLSNWALLALG